MKIEEILSKVDHTLLRSDAGFEEIKATLDEGIKYGTASVCIPPCYVKRAKEYAGNKIKICTVIGFPLGYSTAEAKASECRDAVANGADEIDAVINVGALKSGEYGVIRDELRELRAAAQNKILKIIIETCLLTDGEIIRACREVALAGADFVKTSTGFSKEGATFRAVALMRKHSPPELKIKAAGGISSLADAEKFIELGADRLGTSKIIKILEMEKKNGKSEKLSDSAY